jgi:hypothetical protein
LYLLANAVCDLLIEPLVDDGFKRHAPMLPQSLSGRTAGGRKSCPNDGLSESFWDEMGYRTNVFRCTRERDPDSKSAFTKNAGKALNEVNRSGKCASGRRGRQAAWKSSGDKLSSYLTIKMSRA